MEEKSLSAEREREKAIRFRENAESHKKKLEEKEERLELSRDKIIRRANEEAREILEKAKKVADESIRKYNKWMNDPEALRAMETERGKLRGAMDEVSEGLDATGIGSRSISKKKSSKSPEELEIGDIVMVHSMGVQGTVSTEPVKGKCYVQIGILRSEVDIDDLEYLESQTKQAKKQATITQARNLKLSKAMTVHTEINLIGKTVAEAMPELEKYIDDAAIAGLSQIRIIHGMGTGALRNAVHEELKRNSHVESYRLGEQGEGGYGATVAILR